MDQPPNGPAPHRPLFFLCIVGIGLAVPWCFSSEPAIEDVTQQLRFGVMLLPLLLLLALKFMSSTTAENFSWILPPSEPSSIHKVGGSPWGIGIILIIILSMIWYHSSVLESWHPMMRN